VHKSMEVDLALLGYSAPLRRALGLHSVKAATQHDAQTLPWLQTVPGIGRQSSASSCCMRSTLASVFPACRIASLRAASSSGLKHRLANVMGPQGPRAATRSSRGPSRKRRCSFSGTIPPANRP
jgi:hypothetical protein